METIPLRWFVTVGIRGAFFSIPYFRIPIIPACDLQMTGTCQEICQTSTWSGDVEVLLSMLLSAPKASNVRHTWKGDQ